jgi:hypothetical protein
MVWASKKDRSNWFGSYPKTTDWTELVPQDVAHEQAKFELNRLILRMHEKSGLSYEKIGKMFNVSRSQIHARCIHGKRSFLYRSPVEKYLAGEPHDLSPMTFEITCNGEKA